MPPATPENKMSASKKILVIEDNVTNMKLVQLMLNSAGYEVLKAETAEAGIELARQRLPDLILMDIQLPGMDGLEATRLLKADTGTQHIKIVALTALAMKGDRERILATGCDDYIAKPIKSAEFLGRLQTLL
ncbi:MAG: response regulator [Moraxellaceae bacterium]|nr:response regulator [Moraxellaceae bacterium]